MCLLELQALHARWGQNAAAPHTTRANQSNSEQNTEGKVEQNRAAGIRVVYAYHNRPFTGGRTPRLRAFR